MTDDARLEDWFCREVLPLERSLTHFIQRNWRVADDVIDLRHDVYELAISGARRELPVATRPYLFTIARNHLINQAKRSRIVSFDLVADLESVEREIDLFEAERQLDARDALRRFQAGLEKLSPRVREIVKLRKVEGLNVAETAARLGIGKDAVNHQVMMGMKALADYMLGGEGKIVRPRFGRRRKNGADQ
ncbi:MAG: RNA polymerase sigma factor [Sphingobium limneticum]|jgi:RNA polymerase sigma-70 factor (ECF subfamily)